MKYFSAEWNGKKLQWQENGIALTAHDERALVCTVEAVDSIFCAACPTLSVRYRSSHSLYYDFLLFHAYASLVKNISPGDRITAILIPTVDGNGRHSIEFTCIRIET